MTLRDIEYGVGHASLEELLLSVNRPGDFCAHGRLFVPMPRLEVDGVGLLSFPVPEAQVGALIAAAERAPYGRGPDTLVDTSVRDCRQIDAARIRVAGGAWEDTFRKILDLAATGLGCSAERLDARLYKLLIYEPGGFFAPHRDTEKTDGMIATLAISLPVAGAGGELVVRHRGREVTIDVEAGEPSELAFAAFYADCTHEARPVREGHRLSLVFNLCVRTGDLDTPRRAPDFANLEDRIADRLAEWCGRDDAADKLVWVLDHDYSEAGLSFRTLKGVDAALARVLAPAAERADCELHAAVIHAMVHGDATLDGRYVDGWGGWGDGDADDMQMEEVYESHIWLDGWTGRDGGPPPFEDVQVLPGELLPRGALDDAEPDEQLLHEASGNEGVSLERAYRRAALVMWPRSRTLDIVAGAGIDGAVAWVAAELDRNGGRADRPARHEADRPLADRRRPRARSVEPRPHARPAVRDGRRSTHADLPARGRSAALPGRKRASARRGETRRAGRRPALPDRSGPRPRHPAPRRGAGATETHRRAVPRARGRGGVARYGSNERSGRPPHLVRGAGGGAGGIAGAPGGMAGAAGGTNGALGGRAG